MDYWIIKDGKSEGPYPLGTLERLGISKDTKIWRQGLRNWLPAEDVPEVARALFPDKAATPVEPAGTQAAATQRERGKCPHSRVKAAVITAAVITVMLFGFSPFGILGKPLFYLTVPFAYFSIANAVRGKAQWEKGNASRSRELAAKASIWITLYIVAAITIAPFQFVIDIFG